MPFKRSATVPRPSRSHVAIVPPSRLTADSADRMPLMTLRPSHFAPSPTKLAIALIPLMRPLMTSLPMSTKTFDGEPIPRTSFTLSMSFWNIRGAKVTTSLKTSFSVPSAVVIATRKPVVSR